MTEYVVRFSRRQRLEHVSVMVVFLLLALTGFPQKFFETGSARAIVSFLGGLDRVRWIHRVSGIVFAILTVVHLTTAAFLVLLGKVRMSLVPSRKDFLDAIAQLRYYLGLSDEQAKFDRFDYRQKFEYWGLVLGGLVMIVTGFILYFPTQVARLLPGEVIPASKVAHSNEGLMAFLVVITWHIYNAHLAPEVFPFDTSIFTGKVRAEFLRHEHPLEYARLTGEPAAAAHAAPAASPAEAAPKDGPPADG